MATKKDKSVDEESPYATGPDQPGKPVGPEHDASFHVEDYYDEDGKRIETPWDSEAQKNDPGIEPTPPPDGGSGGEAGEVTPTKATPTTKDG